MKLKTSKKKERAEAKTQKGFEDYDDEELQKDLAAREAAKEREKEFQAMLKKHGLDKSFSSLVKQ